jgi:hypothetical protein
MLRAGVKLRSDARAVVSRASASVLRRGAEDLKEPRPFSLPLFTGVRGRVFLRSSVAQEAATTSPS